MSAEKKRKLDGAMGSDKAMVVSVIRMSGNAYDLRIDLSPYYDSADGVCKSMPIAALREDIAKMVTRNKLFSNEFGEDSQVDKHFCGAWRIQIVDDNAQDSAKKYETDSVISIERLREAAVVNPAEGESDQIQKPLQFMIIGNYQEVVISDAEGFAQHFKTGATESEEWEDGEIDIDRITKRDELIAYKFVLDTDEWNYSDSEDGNFLPQIAKVINLLLSHKCKSVLRVVHFLSSDPLTGQFINSSGTKLDYSLFTSPLCPLEEVELMRTEVYPFGHALHLRLSSFDAWDDTFADLGVGDGDECTDHDLLQKLQASAQFQSSQDFVVGNATFVARYSDK